MAIGYYNFGNIQQGNQSVVNSMLGLGKQISSAIETHAATESAKAMLPMLQQQYQTGMGLIANGHAEGLSNIYQASMLASQNPILAPMGGHMVNMGNSAMQQVSHNLRTRAAQEGALIRAGMAHPGSYDANGNYIPAAKQAAPITGTALANQTAKYRTNIANTYNNLKTGLEDYLTGKDSDAASSFAQGINYYQAAQKDLPGFSDPNFENAIAAKRAIEANRDPALVIKRLKTMTSQPKKTSPVPTKNPDIAPQSGMGSDLAASGGLTQADQADQEEPQTPEEDQSIS